MALVTGTDERSPYVTHVRRHSVVERWALHVLRATQSGEDLKTVSDWARYVGVSPSSLRELCRLLGIRPHDACSVMRSLRALIKSSDPECAPDLLMDVSDRRTLRTFLAKAGPHFTSYSGAPPLQEFLRTQQFVPVHNPGIKLLLAHYASSPLLHEPALD